MMYYYISRLLLNQLITSPHLITYDTAVTPCQDTPLFLLNVQRVNLNLKHNLFLSCQIMDLKINLLMKQTI